MKSFSWQIRLCGLGNHETSAGNHGFIHCQSGFGWRADLPLPSLFQDHAEDAPSVVSDFTSCYDFDVIALSYPILETYHHGGIRIH